MTPYVPKTAKKTLSQLTPIEPFDFNDHLVGKEIQARCQTKTKTVILTPRITPPWRGNDEEKRQTGSHPRRTSCNKMTTTREGDMIANVDQRQPKLEKKIQKQGALLRKDIGTSNFSVSDQPASSSRPNAQVCHGTVQGLEVAYERK